MRHGDGLVVTDLKFFNVLFELCKNILSWNNDHRPRPDTRENPEKLRRVGNGSNEIKAEGEGRGFVHVTQVINFKGYSSNLVQVGANNKLVSLYFSGLASRLYFYQGLAKSG